MPSYIATLLMLYLAAVRLGEARGQLTSTQADDIRHEITSLADALEQTIALTEFICCGGLRVDYLITAQGQARLREMGGNALYAAVGARVWSDEVGLLARVGQNYPQGWLDALKRHGLDTSGVRSMPDDLSD